MNVQLSDEEYTIICEALMLYSSVHHKEFLDNNRVERGGSRDRWLRSHKLIERLEMIEGHNT